MTRPRQPSYGGTAEAERLRGIHRARRPVTCVLCDDGDTPVDGFHLVYTDDYDILGTWKVPCGKEQQP